MFGGNLARHGFNFSRIVVFSIAPLVLDPHERDRAKARNDGIVGDKAVSAVRRLECDAKARFSHDRVKVVFNWIPYRADARLCAFFAPKEDLPKSVPHKTYNRLDEVYRKCAGSGCPFGNNGRDFSHADLTTLICYFYGPLRRVMWIEDCEIAWRQDSDRTNTDQEPAEAHSVRGGFASRPRNVKKTYNK